MSVFSVTRGLPQGDTKRYTSRGGPYCNHQLLLALAEKVPARLLTLEPMEKFYTCLLIIAVAAYNST